MITLYTWTTPNGRKPAIMLEELGIPYVVKPINIMKDEQFAPEYLKISPNNKIPCIVDDEAEGGPLSVFESGAILTYLAEKTGKLLPKSGPARVRTFEWLHWQVSGQGPMMGQLGYFAVFAKEKLPAAEARYKKEVDRLLGVMNRRLGEATYLAGDEYSIADIAAYAWSYAATTFLREPLEETLLKVPHFHRWLKLVGERPAVKKGMTIPEV